MPMPTTTKVKKKPTRTKPAVSKRTPSAKSKSAASKTARTKKTAAATPKKVRSQQSKKASPKRVQPSKVKSSSPKKVQSRKPKSSVKRSPGPLKSSAPLKKPRKVARPDKSIVKFDPLQHYLAEISQYRLLTREEERALAIRVQEHEDKEAAYQLVTANLRLVVKIALEFQRVWMQNLLDLIQEGNIGLMQAVKKFDPYKNVKFSYYASFWIKAYILKFIMDNWRLVKIGTTQGQRKLFFKLKKEKQKLIDEGFDPKPKLLSERLGVSEREIIDMDQRLDGWDVSLDAPLKEDSDTERIEFLSTESTSAEEHVAKKEMEVLLHTKIREFKKRLTDRELEIFNMRIFSDTPVTLQEIGDRYGISRERVRQVEKNVIKKMREFFKREIPDFDAYSYASGAE
jgi:RNA polymerase sigma-32 factor